jgi:quercetin dioxygenase-like cupin family protein
VEIQPKQPTAHGPAETFTGDVWFDVIAAGVSPSRLRVSTMRFSPSAHTAWHRHANGQTLHIAEGRRFVQARGGPVIEVRPGDTIYTPPGRHWHGATPDHPPCLLRRLVPRNVGHHGREERLRQLTREPTPTATASLRSTRTRRKQR